MANALAHPYVARDQLAAGEAWATCPLGGTWRTIRPASAAWSASEAHTIAHRKGWRLECQLPPATPLPEYVRHAARGKARA